MKIFTLRWRKPWLEANVSVMRCQEHSGRESFCQNTGLERRTKRRCRNWVRKLLLERFSSHVAATLYLDFFIWQTQDRIPSPGSAPGHVHISFLSRTATVRSDLRKSLHKALFPWSENIPGFLPKWGSSIGIGKLSFLLTVDNDWENKSIRGFWNTDWCISVSTESRKVTRLNEMICL